MQKNVPLVKQNVMKLEIFILGRQIIDQRRKNGWERVRRERIEKGSRETEQKFISDCRYRVIESSSLVPVLFREVFSHPYISFFRLLVNSFSVTCFRTFLANCY